MSPSLDATVARLDPIAVVISTAVPVQIPGSTLPHIQSLTIPTADFENLWVKMPEVNRDDVEVAVARRYPLHPAVAVSAKWPLPDTWIHRTVQRSPELTVTDEADVDDLLYTIYSTNVSVLGARQTDQLFTILMREHEAVTFTSTETDDVLGTLRLRIFAVVKAMLPPQHQHYYIDFSPIVAVTAILTPSDAAEKGKAELFRVYDALDTARVHIPQERFASIVTLLTATLKKRLVAKYHFLTRERLRELQRIHDDEHNSRRKAEILKGIASHRIGTLDRHGFEPITEWGTRYFRGTIAGSTTTDAESLVSSAPDRHEVRRELCTLMQHILAPGLYFDGGSYMERLTQGAVSLNVREYVRERLPEDTYVLTTPQSISVLAPGRCFEMIHDGSIERAGIQKRFRRACAWNVLALSLIAMQEALLAWYHRSIGDERISAQKLARVAESAIGDFADYYDIAFFKSSAGAFYRDAYEHLQTVNGLDHEYEMLRERLSLILAKNNGEALLGVNRTLVGTWLGIALAMLVAIVSFLAAITSGQSQDRYLQRIETTLNQIANTRTLDRRPITLRAAQRSHLRENVGLRRAAETDP